MQAMITLSGRMEITRAAGLRYQAATGATRSRILAEFVALTGYHPKYAIALLNRPARERECSRGRKRVPLYDEAARQALIVLWEASDRICGKRLKPLLPILVGSLERHGHLKLDGSIRSKVLTMSAATIDRLLRAPKATSREKKRRHVVPEIRRRVPVRTFAEWNEPTPGCMEMDLVSHCGDSNRGSYVHSLVLTDIATGWTECAPIIARDRTLVVEALSNLRNNLPFALQALDVDNGSEFLNETLLNYCVNAGIELTRSRPYRKNDQAWIEQKNGAVVRRMIGYRRFEGIAAAQTLSALYAVSRFFVNFFQPSFKLAEKSREGARVTKRYHAPQTPCERLLAHDEIGPVMKTRLREVAEALDPLQLLEEIRVLQAHLVSMGDDALRGEMPTRERNLGSFLATLSSAWRAGEIRPTHAAASSPPRFLRRVEILTAPAVATPPSPAHARAGEMDGDGGKAPATTPPPARQASPSTTPTPLRRPRRPNAFRSIWPEICRRLEARPNLNAAELLDDLIVEYPGRYVANQLQTLQRRLKQWRTAAKARGVVIEHLKYRPHTKPRNWRTRVDPFAAVWPELVVHLEADPDRTGRELLAKLQARYPGRYGLNLLRTLQARLQKWRADAARRLVFGVQPHPLAPTIRHTTASL